MTTLSIQSLQVPYSKKGILPAISFELNSPALVFITGSNGVGKSTLLKLISGSINSNKAIRINQKVISDFSLIERARLLGFLAQQHAIHFPLLVKDLVVMGRYAHKETLEIYSEKDYAMAKEVLEELGILYLYDKDFLTLSGGEQQLCMLAQLALQDPAIILLDEPTQSLDLYNKDRVFKWMENQVYKKGKLLICVTHDLHWIPKTAGYLLSLNTRFIELQKITEELIEHTIDELRSQT